MENYLKVKNNETLMRDASTGAILNFDTAERTAIIKKRLNVMSYKQQIEAQTKQINNIQNELSEIKEIILSLIQSKP